MITPVPSCGVLDEPLLVWVEWLWDPEDCVETVWVGGDPPWLEWEETVTPVSETVELGCGDGPKAEVLERTRTAITATAREAWTALFLRGPGTVFIRPCHPLQLRVPTATYLLVSRP